MIDEKFYSKLIEFVKENGYECIANETTIALRKNGRTEFFIKIEDVKPLSDVIENERYDYLDFKI